MSIIILSSDSLEKGKEIAQKTCTVLDYGLVDRGLLSVIESRCEVPRDKLEWALDELPSSRGRAADLQRQALGYIQATTLGELLKDNLVCYGLAAHLYVLGVSHALRVRILADPKELIEEISLLEKVSMEKARDLMERRRKLRQDWSLTLYGQDETDPSQYDLVISLSQIDTEEAVKIISQTVDYRRFAPMTYSINCLKDAELSSRVHACLRDKFPSVKVRADGGTVVVETKGSRRNKLKTAATIKEVVQPMEGVDYVEVHVLNKLFKKAPARSI
jgi:cytidylate kinase